jgi:hypothetical protein
MLRVLVLSSCVVAAIGCSRASPHGSSEAGLDLTAGDPATGIEARYREGDHAVVLRAFHDGAAIRSEIIDEHGHSVTALASTIVEGRPLRTPEGQRPVPIPALFENAKQLSAALQVSKHGLRQLRDALPAGAADAPTFRDLSQQIVLLRKALKQTRLRLLQEWGSEARRSVTLTPEERDRFFAILQRQAKLIAATTTVRGRSPAATDAPSPNAEIEALLGPERYAQYQNRRKAWLAQAGEPGQPSDDVLEVVP